MSQRVQQVESLLKRSIAEVIMRGLSDPRMRGMVSVTRVDASPDLKQATVYVTILPQQHEKLTMAALTASTRHIQSKLRPKLSMKVVPFLNFKLDEDLKKEQALWSEIAEGMQRTRETDVDSEAVDGDETDVATDRND